MPGASLFMSGAFTKRRPILIEFPFYDNFLFDQKVSGEGFLILGWER